MSSQTPLPSQKNAPPQLSSLKRIPKPVFKTLPTPTSTPAKATKSTKMSNMIPKVIGVLGVSYLIMRKKY